MKHNQGNVIIVFVIILISVFIILLLSLKTKIQEGWNTSSEQTETQKKAPALKETTSPQSAATQTTQQPESTLSPHKPDKYEYYNDISHVQNNETINPFINVLNDNPSLPSTPNSPTNPHQTAKEIIKTKANQIKSAPNGFQLPDTTGYLFGYLIKNKTGKLNVTIKNDGGQSNLIVFLYLKKPYNEFRELDLNDLTSAIYVAAGDSFTFKNVNSGHYKIEWINLANMNAYRSGEFTVFQDNKFAYDRIFTFNSNHTQTKNKAAQIPITNYYR